MIYTEEFFQKKQVRIIAPVTMDFVRHRYIKLLQSSDRLIGLLGARGVGKTTLLLQYLKSSESGSYLYLSADDVALHETTLYDVAEQLVERGGSILVIDEIHLYPRWAQEIKNIYDSFPTIKIRFSGSSMLNILYEQYDLSRRAVIYPVEVLSFREYMELAYKAELPELSFSDVLTRSIEISTELVVAHPTLYRSFLEYLEWGTYPFFIENRDSYRQKLFNALEKVIERDIPTLYSMNYEHLVIFKRLIYRICEARVPYKVNVAKLASEFGVTVPTLYNILDLLEKTKIFHPIKRASSKVTRKPDKLLFNNSNILAAYSEEYGFEVNRGTIRETFFASMFEDIHYSETGDFLIGNRTFEIGGRNKTFDQIKDIPDSYLVLDIDSTVNAKKIPLWLFGLMR